ncbi:MAG TPA: hypothetical protein VK960_10660 [Acidimicrobiia bacterium]|nr:hypothetical protein [Acidimicrobiia bacterium]
MSVSRITLATAFALLAALPAARSDAAEAPPVIRPHVISSVGERFGVDADRDGFIDMPNTFDYVQGSCTGDCTEARFDVLLDAAIEGLAIDPARIAPREYRWEIRGPGLVRPLLYSSAYPELLVTLPEGEFEVTVSTPVTVGWATLSASVSERFAVEDVLVVAIGDSYASGEGNPEVRRRDGSEARWADSADPDAAAAHAAAHRSSLAWPARLALAMERSDPHASVTFVSVAASGAGIERGLLGSRGGAAPQVDQLRALVGEREIDLLLIQAGGNDVGFAHAVQALVEADPLFDPVCYDLLVENTFASVADGDWSRGVSLGYDAPLSVVCRPAESRRGWESVAGLDGLPEQFSRLATALEGFEIGEVVLVGYPDPTGGDAAGGTCREIVGDTASPLGFHEIDRNEQQMGVARILRPLNAALEASARAHGWRYVDGIAEAFAAGHGYCAPWPDYGSPSQPGGSGRGSPSLDDPDRWFRNPGRSGGPMLMGDGLVTWYRTAAQSAALQGPGARYMTKGTLHPNELGHEAIARLVLAALREEA